MHSGPGAPPFNLVVESSVRSPDGQRRKSKSEIPATSMRERRNNNSNMNIARPETEKDFLALDFSSRCAVAGLQLGLTKVFLRREAFDRIEAMRSEKFFQAASAIQKLVRGKLCRQYFLSLRAATIIVQSVFRMKLCTYKVEGLRIMAAIVTIQSSWRRFSASLYMSELVMARRYAATIIQRAYRASRERDALQLSEDDVIRAVVKIQAMHRGGRDRIMVAEIIDKAEFVSAVDDSSPVRQVPSPVVQRRVPVQEQRQIALPKREITPVKPSVVIATQADAHVLSELFKEVQNENWAVVENILDKHPELAEAPDMQTGELALHKIARHSSAWTLLIDMVLVLFPKALIHRDNMGALPIHHASAHDNLSALEIIYSAYREGINENDKMGRLPIHVAANYDAVDAVKFLLSKSSDGAYTMVYRPPPDTGGGLPLHIACANHASIGVITALLAENFASAKRADENGDLPLHLLLRCGEVVDPVIVKTLLTCFVGALSRTDMNGDLPLSIAIKYQCRSAVVNALLMQYPEAAGVLNGEGHSPLFLAFKHNADDRTIMGLLNHAPELATSVDRKTGLLPIQVATENEHSHFIVHNLLKRDLPIDMKEKIRAQLVPHHYSWNHIVSNTDDLYHQVVTKVLQSCTQPQVLALAHVEGPDGKIALASATPVCKHEMRVMLRLFNTLEVVNQRPAYTNPVSDTQIFYALRYDPPPQHSGAYTILHEEKKEGGENDYVEDYDDQSIVSGVSRSSMRSTLSTRSQQTIDDKLRHIRKEKGQQVIAKLTSRSDVVERELKVRKDYHLSRHYVPAIISVHHTVQHAAYSEAMAEPGYCITMEGADTTAENLMLDMRKSGKAFPVKALKRIGISLLHMHEHGIIHGDFGTHNIGKFGSRWKLLGVGGSVPLGCATDPERGFYHPPEAIVVENKKVPIGKKHGAADIVSIEAQATYDIWAYGVVVYEAIAGVPLAPYACRGKRQMTMAEVYKIGAWDEHSVKKALKHVSDDEVSQDILKRLLHHDPDRRISSMRLVLEHPFFTGGNLPKNRDAMGQASPATVSSSPSNPSPSPRPRGREPQSNGNHPKQKPTGREFPGVQVSMSTESIENRENNTVKRRVSAPDSPSSNSEKSVRSFGGGRVRNFFRRPSSGGVKS
jgi:serine/threonine protein kinase